MGEVRHQRRPIPRGDGAALRAVPARPDLGSLLDPHTVTEDMFALGFDTLRGTVERALKKIEARDDPDQAAVGVAAQGIALAASLMSREFTLVATNVPYLGSGDLPKGIRDWCQEHYFDFKADLATVFIDRCLSLLNAAGALAVVSTQGWWFMGCFSAFRRRIISEKRIALLLR